MSREDDTASYGSRSPERNPMRGRASSWELVIVASPVAWAFGRRVTLSDEPVIIERVMSEAGEYDRWMSRRHMTAVVDGDGVWVRDAGSNNGTWRAGEQIPAVGQLLGHGEVVLTGRTLWMAVRDAMPSDDPQTLLVGTSSVIGLARDTLSLVVAQVARRLERRERVRQAMLITGPRGSGKQVVAREAHRLLTRRRQGEEVPFRQVSAPSLADGTGVADLFGVAERYATGVKARPGYFEQAHGGLLLLDEVADIEPAMQAKLLNVLEEREVTPLGDSRPRPFDCLVLSATNADLAAKVARGEFRADLADRLGRFVIRLPALDDRPEDIPFLAHKLLSRYGPELRLKAEVVESLVTQRWPGNVRALDAAMDRLATLTSAAGLGESTADLLRRALDRKERAAPEPMLGVASDPSFEVATARDIDVEELRARVPIELVPSGGRSRRRTPRREDLLELLREADWNIAEVARRVGKDRRQVRRWMRYLDIEREE